MTNSQVGGLIGFAVLLALGQTLFKTAALSTARRPHSAVAMFSLLQAPSFWGALLLYGGATLLWIYLLQSVPLSRAYPFAALGFVIVPTLAVLLFGERVTPMYMLGAALIVAGIVVTARA